MGGLEKQFLEIELAFLSCKLDKKCSEMCLRIMSSHKESVGDQGWYYTPPPEFLGSRYAGIVIMGGNPAMPKDAHWNPKVRAATTAFVETPTIGTGRAMNKALGDFIPHFNVVRNGNLAYQKWGVDLEQCAYVNAFKCRTLNNANVFASPLILELCTKIYLVKQMELLKPKLVIYLWKGHFTAIQNLGLDPGFGGTACFRSGRRDLSAMQREADQQKIRVLVQHALINYNE